MRHKFLQLACLMLILLSSCKKSFLEQTNPNSVTIPQFFTSETDVLLALNGCYQSLRSNSCIGEESDLYTDQRSDDTGTNDNQSNAGEPFQFNNFSLLPTNTYLKSHWIALYQSISRCNVLLSNIDKVQFASDSTKKQYIAEAKFIRAYIYFQLVRKWGDIPMTTEALSTPEQVTASTFRAKTPDVFAQIIADLHDAAVSNLPKVQPAANRGRVSMQAVTAILGQAYLTRAITVTGANKTSDLDSADYYLTACYNMRGFSSLSDIPYADVFDVNKKATCPELIWQIVNIQGDINYHSNIAADAQAKGETINSQKTASGTGYNVTHDLVNEYEVNDPRKDFSVKYANDPIVKDWFITKFRDASSTAGKTGYGGNDWILIRYADVILMLAEVNFYKGNTTAAIRYVDMVRERAGMPSYAVSMTDPTYKQKFPTLKLAILHERRVELAFEHHRLFDLLRFFTIDELVAYMHTKNQADWGLAQVSNFGTKDRYYPIPYYETILDPVKMYQNPGY
ncbi:RagB/SusD family nutrient uptake outer membrane protein [Danxiaibacter flavus]|uniref:RagB/SusD family nutrient uptake outer membrane protein n=1 Tax=Danxiaibacter flavus TaxID=3049108 RepID=A0ABV3ZE87_9BACT|nr:RagB/SusD family nutrient uptake outer membrane protein [Chitinophagaceae bacterium DXS]